MEKVIKASWKNWAGSAVENLVLKETQQGILAESDITSKGAEHFTVTYTIMCDHSWRVRTLSIKLVETRRKLTLESDGLGRWSLDPGVIVDLNGAIDIDISATPFTNTLPIRRLKLKKNQAEEISVVYITVPELNVSVARQRYTCLIPNRCYRFEQIDTGFVREIETDENGLVLVYPGLFKRIKQRE